MTRRLLGCQPSDANEINMIPTTALQRMHSKVGKLLSLAGTRNLQILLCLVFGYECIRASCMRTKYGKAIDHHLIAMDMYKLNALTSEVSYLLPSKTYSHHDRLSRAHRHQTLPAYSRLSPPVTPLTSTVPTLPRLISSTATTDSLFSS